MKLGYEPYASPHTRGARRLVVPLYRAYAVFAALLSAGAATLLLLAWDPSYAGEGKPEHAALIAVLLASALAHVVGALVPRRPWGWTLGMVLLAVGLPSLCVPFALPLLLVWMKPETKAAFMRV